MRRQIQWFKENGYYEGTLDIDEVTDYASVDFALQVLGRLPIPHRHQVKSQTPLHLSQCPAVFKLNQVL